MYEKHMKKDFSKLHPPKRYGEIPLAEIIKLLPRLQHRRIADIGCGKGFFTRALLKAVGKEGVVFAIDIDSSDLRELKIHLNSPRLVIMQSTETEIPLSGNELDVAVCAFMLHELLREVKRILKPGGHLLIVEWKIRGRDKKGKRKDRISVNEMVELLSDVRLCIEKRKINLQNVYIVIAHKMEVVEE